MNRCFLFAAAFLFPSLNAASVLATQTVSFTPAPLLGGGPGSVEAISADGTTVVGNSASGGYRWTLGQAPAVLIPGGGATAVSADGSVVAGYTSSSAFRWSQASGFQSVPWIPNADAAGSPTGISADGSVIVGTQHTLTGYRGFRWSQANGTQMVPLPQIPSTPGEEYATGVSADGNRVVGWSGLTTGYHGYVWSPSNGFVMSHLGFEETSYGSFAYDISSDGLRVLGRTQYPGNVMQSWIYSEADGYAIIPHVPGLTTMGARAISGDGLTVVGATNWTDLADGFFWTAQTGTVKIADLLTANGIDLTGWTIGMATDVSYDGKSIIGIGYYNHQDRGWVVTIPTPGSVIAIAFAASFLPRRRRTC